MRVICNLGDYIAHNTVALGSDRNELGMQTRLYYLYIALAIVKIAQ